MYARDAGSFAASVNVLHLDHVFVKKEKVEEICSSRLVIVMYVRALKARRGHRPQC